jgi:hypothetical protein
MNSSIISLIVNYSMFKIFKLKYLDIHIFRQEHEARLFKLKIMVVSEHKSIFHI